MLFRTLGASLLGNLLISKEIQLELAKVQFSGCN